MTPHGPRYVLCPGYVISRTDGQRHFVGAEQLRRLYGVPARECVTYPQGDGDEADIRRRIWRDPPGAIQLMPRHNGDYRLPALP
jgi:hypothetical protein